MNASSPDRLANLLADVPEDVLAFSPVPVKARRDGWSVERQRGFMARLALCGCPATAARAVGMSRESAYRLRARPAADGFAAAWEAALGLGECRVDDLAIERALLGEVRPVFYRGRRSASGSATTIGCSSRRWSGCAPKAATEKARFSRSSPSDLCNFSWLHWTSCRPERI